MNEMNSLEMQLRSWELRPPSAALKHRIFPIEPRRPGIALAFRWLAPAAACALLALTVIHQDSSSLSTARSTSSPIMAMIRSNQSPIASFSNSPSRAAASFTAAGFEWTNRSESTSSISSFLPAK
jgi:hypothetical protein